MNFIFPFVGSFLYLIIIGAIFLTIFKKSKFWPIFLSVEYFYIIGLGFYPIFLFLDIVDIPVRYSIYRSVASFNILTFLHIIFYAIGAAVGFFFCKRFTIVGSDRLVLISRGLKMKPFRFFYMLAGVAISAALLYLYLVGFERAILGASSSRGGDFSEFAGFEGYVFLKRFTILGLYAIAFFPFIVANNIKVKSSFLILFVIGILGYMITVSRFALFESIVVPLMIYCSYRLRINIKGFILLLILIIISYFVLLYGKEFVQVFSSYYFLGNRFEFSKSNETGSFFDGFSHLLFSIDAGVAHYFRSGPFIAHDIFLSFLGFLPSGVFTSLGMSDFSYQLVSDNLKSLCVNTEIIVGSKDECYIPPYFTGISAYVMPLVGGFIFALFRFYIYSVMHRSWIVLKNDAYYLVIPYVVFLIANQFMLLIPSTISLAVFFCIIIFLYFSVGRFFRTSHHR